MKLIKEEFEEFAKGQGYASGAELYEYIGLNRNTYERYKKEVPIGKFILRFLCDMFGAVEVSSFIIVKPRERQMYFDILDEY